MARTPLLGLLVDRQCLRPDDKPTDVGEAASQQEIKGEPSPLQFLSGQPGRRKQQLPDAVRCVRSSKSVHGVAHLETSFRLVQT